MNHLTKALSPYLQQHANNPVDWYPWGIEALQKARAENKPILLSIGYAACHWCHVMAHESFEDADTAKLMNELFINIKVDREERPDLDKIYQTAHQLLTQQAGGWPLTLFLAPDDLTPFFSGTYFPPLDRYQLPSFKKVLHAIAEAYTNEQDTLRKQNESLRSVMQNINVSQDSKIELTKELINNAVNELENRLDKIHGGFGGAPKFPQPPLLNFLLEQDAPILLNTFDHMKNGGIYDQVGGGFFRYAVDVAWLIPHFEKMAYDNGQLLYLYALAAQIFNDASFRTVTEETADWLLRDLQAKTTAFFASIDADSEGKEGKFYTFTPDEVKATLTTEEYAIVAHHYNLSQPSNFAGVWHLSVTHPLVDEAEETLLRNAKQKLITMRATRIAPFRDEKILTAWNALIVKGLLATSLSLKKPVYQMAAEKTLDFLQSHLFVNGRLYAVYKDNIAYQAGFLDDHAYLLDALLYSLTFKWSTKRLLFAVQLADQMLEQFIDPEGGFFFTANDQEKLLFRPKNMMDDITPSGNGIAARALLLLGNLLGEPRYLQAVQETLETAAPMLQRFPGEHSSLLLALKDYLSPPKIVVIRGLPETLSTWQEKARANLSIMNFAIPADETNLPAALAAKKWEGQTVAYVCEGLHCLAPLTELSELVNTLSS